MTLRILKSLCFNTGWSKPSVFTIQTPQDSQIIYEKREDQEQTVCILRTLIFSCNGSHRWCYNKCTQKYMITTILHWKDNEIALLTLFVDSSPFHKLTPTLQIICSLFNDMKIFNKGVVQIRTSEQMVAFLLRCGRRTIFIFFSFVVGSWSKDWHLYLLLS